MVIASCYSCGVKRPLNDFKYCGACRIATYCSRDCAKAHYARHRVVCADSKASSDAVEAMALSQPAEQAFKTQFTKLMLAIEPAVTLAITQAYSVRLRGSPTPKRPSAAELTKDVMVLCFSFNYRKFKKGAPLLEQFKLTHAATSPIEVQQVASLTLSGLPTCPERLKTMVQEKFYTQEWVDNLGKTSYPTELPRFAVAYQATHCRSCWDLTGGPSYSAIDGNLVVPQTFEPPPGRVFPIAEEDKWVENLMRRYELMKDPKWKEKLLWTYSGMAMPLMTELLRSHPHHSQEEAFARGKEYGAALGFYGVE